MPTAVPANGQPFVIVPQLTRIAMAVQNRDFIADTVCPRVQVPGELFQYTKVTTKDRFQHPDDLINRTGHLNELEFAQSDETDRTIDRGLAAPVPQVDVDRAASANMADPRGAAVEGITQIMLLNRELRAADLLFNAANYTLKKTLDGNAGGYRWDDATNGDPIGYMEDAMAAMVVRPNRAVLGYNVMLAVRKHPKTISRLYGSSSTRGTARLEDIASELGLDGIDVGSAWKDSTKKGQTASLGRVWGNYAALIRVSASLASTQTVEPVFAFTAQYEGRTAGTWFDPGRGKKGVEMLKVTESVKELISWTEAGYLFSTPLAP